jgi:hypothetical protein
MQGEYRPTDRRSTDFHETLSDANGLAFLLRAFIAVVLFRQPYGEGTGKKEGDHQAVPPGIPNKFFIPAIGAGVRSEHGLQQGERLEAHLKHGVDRREILEPRVGLILKIRH